MCLTNELENLGPHELVDWAAYKSKDKPIIPFLFFIFLISWRGERLVEVMWISFIHVTDQLAQKLGKLKNQPV